VYADGDVGIKLNLEISNVSDTIVTQGGRAYQIGTRSAQTALRLHDGETQILAGLISDDDRKAAQKVPAIGQLPLLGRLFSNHSDDSNKREIVLSITPHIIRPQAQPDLRFADAWSGSEGSLRDRPLRLEPLSVLKAPQQAGQGGMPAVVVQPPRPGLVPQPAAQPSPPAPPQPASLPTSQPPAAAPAAPPTEAGEDAPRVQPRALPGKIPLQ
jgi:general secretion pathway protein D